jgi:hypothetical protein
MEAKPAEDAEPADDAWEKHKRLITTLYASWSLDEVQRHLKQCHAFSASYVQLTSPSPPLSLTRRLERMPSSANYKNGTLRKTQRQIK